MRQIKLLVSGRVQGVYFRLFTQRKARQLGVKGFVRNLADGQVEIVAEAEHEALEQLIAWSHKGPITARVDHVELADIQVDEVFTAFEIR